MRRIKSIAFVTGGILALSVAPLVAAVPPDLPAIEFPVSTTSVVTVVVAAGAVIMLAVWGPKIGFKLWQKLASRLSKAI